MDNELDLTGNALKLLPSASLLVLAYSIFKLLVFYNFFSLNILEYTDISEVVPIVLKDFLWGLFVSGVGFLLGYINPDRRRQEIANKNLILSENAPNIFQRIFYYFKAQPILYPYPLIIAVTIIVTLIKKDADKLALFYLWFISFLPFVIYVIPFEIILGIKKRRGLMLSRNSVILLFTTFYLISFGFSNSMQDYITIRYHHSTKGSFIVVNGKNLISTNSYYIIGHTKRSVFFYNEKNNKVTVYLTSTISKMNLN